MRKAVDPIPGATLEFFKLSVELGTTGGLLRYVRLAQTSADLASGASSQIAAQRLRPLNGLNRAQAREALTNEGFQTRGPSPAGN